MISETDVYCIGTLGKAHGVKGEVHFSFTDDVWLRVAAPYLFIKVDGLLVPFFISSRRRKGEMTALLKFEGIETCDDLQELCGQDVFFPYSLKPQDEDEEYTWDYFRGFLLVDNVKGELGTIDEVDSSTENVLFVVGSLLVPAAEDLIVDIDHEKRIVTMQLPNGLTEI